MRWVDVGALARVRSVSVERTAHPEVLRRRRTPIQCVPIERTARTEGVSMSVARPRLNLAVRGCFLGLVALAACSGEVMTPPAGGPGAAGTGSPTTPRGGGSRNPAPTGPATGVGGEAINAT